ncbi:hypothetical protein E4U56_003348 [Claviceps arundinis]|uniref:2EXR domain-containing protein n=1 Tax=Claviceps arundinis TaxID=1623583 RepID=A0A9P7MYG8_9HYPO|nr:hypothetical protein E4U56_003348 [Claviceps arundinis]
MCSYEPMSIDDMSDISYDADSNPGNHLCLIDDVAEKPCGESSRFQDGDTAPDTFPQFMRFPPELRLQIWQLHCPDLSAKARVLPFTMDTQIDCSCQGSSHSDYEALAEQTKELRAVLSTHSESRSIALRKYPDELVLDQLDSASGAGIVRFRKETDVIFVSEVVIWEDCSMLEFGSEIENLAVGGVDDYSGDQYLRDEALLQVVPGIKGLFPNLKRLFSHRSAPAKHNDIEKWCVAEHVHSYMIDSDDKTTLFYWPDLDAYPDFARSSVPELCSLEEMKEAGVELWPMVEFESWKPREIPDGPEFEDDSSSNDSIYSYDDSSVDGTDPDNDSNADGTDSDDDSSAENTDWSDSDDDSDADSSNSNY